MASPDIYGMDRRKIQHKYPTDQRINATNPGDSQAFPASATITFVALTKVSHKVTGLFGTHVSVAVCVSELRMLHFRYLMKFDI